MEQWKAIEGTVYEISTEGRLKNAVRNKVLSISTDRYGYPKISTKRKDGTWFHSTIHRLVATAFIPNPHNKPEINHINGIKDDNRVENLEWVTRQENITHSWQTGLRSKERMKGSGCGKQGNKTAVYDLQGNLLGVYKNNLIATKTYGVDQSCGIRVANGERKQAKGYVFKYIDEE